MSCFPMFRSFLLYVDVRVIGSHACYARLRSMCLCIYLQARVFRSMFPHACMLGFVFFCVFMLTSTCLGAHSHAYMHISMLICVDQCVYMLISMFSTCFMPSLMCLCASCHVCVPRPRLACHVMCYCSHFVTLSFFLVFWPNG